MSHDPKMQTYTGRSIDPFEVRPEDIDINDIAHSLSFTCRYGGHCKPWFSTGEHSVIVSRHVPVEMTLEGLLHDAAEYLVGDVVKPIKHRAEFRPYVEAEHVVEFAIRQAFGLSNDPKVWAEIKRIETAITVDESHALLTRPLPGTGLGTEIIGYGPELAEVLFLTRFYELRPDLLP